MLVQRISFATLLAIPSIYAQFIGSNLSLGSCADVECPPLAATGSAAGCEIVNRTYQIIGISTFSSAIAPEGENLTWTIGAKSRDGLGEKGRDRVVEKGFYLGTPPGLQLKPENNETLPFQGCAVILNTNETLRPERGSWACPDVIGKDCYNQLMDSMTEYVRESPRNETSEQVCQSMLKSVDFIPSACGGLVEGNGWRHMEAIPLTGPAAPSPPTEAQNSSSKCHPTLPKSNDLTFIYAYNDTGTVRANTTIPMFRGINLAMSVFWSPDGDVEDALSEPDAHMSCLWPVDDDGQTKETEVKNGARMLDVSRSIGLVALVAGVLMV